ncbi:MAG: BrnT family toxin [Terracidiphilus sp.]
MQYEWDPAKAQANLRKHKVPFLMACEVFKDSSRLERLDVSSDYDEERWIVLGRVEQTILSVVFTQRGQRIRLISARRANRNEQQNYWTGDISA